MPHQTASHILMIEPTRFEFNTQTAATNSFQRIREESDTQQNALSEFREFVYLLQNAGVDVSIIQDKDEPHTPDSIFPNNWFSTHDNGTLVLYPMATENRRAERRQEIIEHIKKLCRTTSIIDITSTEKSGQYLEGTGSMVLDRANHVCYCALSGRTHHELATQWCETMGYTLVTFNTLQSHGAAVYHTNVVMSIGERIAICCFDAVPDSKEREILRKSLEQSGRYCMAITVDQMYNFAGNMLNVQSSDGNGVWIMSRRAWDSCTEEQQRIVLNDGIIVKPTLTTIENIGGGSARCMIAELFPTIAKTH